MIRRTRVLVLGACVAMGASAAVTSCSSDKPSDIAASDAGDEELPTKKDSGAPHVEAGEPEAGKPLPPTIPPCVGAPPMSLTIAGERAYVTMSIGLQDAGTDADIDAADASDAELDASVEAGPAPSSPGDFVIDFGTTGSTIDLAAFAQPPTPITCYGDAAAPGADCSFQGFDFFGDWGTVWLRTADYSGIQSKTRQAGIIATDFLSLSPFTIDYSRGEVRRAEPSAFCTDAQLLGAGFMPLSSEGFFTNNLSKLRPLSDVLTSTDGSTTGFVVPNVPTVPIRIAGVSALAQLDTGYDDRLAPHSINVNDALFSIIEAEQKRQNYTITRDSFSDVYLTTCIPGYSEKVLAYHLVEGQTFDFIATGGSVARSEKTVVIFVKQASDKTASCGGIGTWTVPAAQVGSSFYVDAQALILDPISSRVWIPKN